MIVEFEHIELISYFVESVYEVLRDYMVELVFFLL